MTQSITEIVYTFSRNSNNNNKIHLSNIARKRKVELQVANNEIT